MLFPWLVAVTLLLSTELQSQRHPVAPAKETVARDVESIVRARLADPKGPASISVAIVRAGEPIVEQAWGTANAARNRPAAASMTYHLASVSKQFTAALVLKLVDRRRLSLKDTLDRHLTGLPREWRPITIEQLLNHTSGLKRDYGMSAALGLFTSPSTATLLEWAMREELAYAPGTRHLYSNIGYRVLAALIEKLYGKPYRDVLREEIARPLGLKTLGWCTAPEQKATAVIGHWRSPQGKLEPAEEPSPDLASGAGGLCASAGDVGRWNQALHGGRVLSPASYKAMITPRGAAIKEKYGFGIRVLREPSGAAILTHDGGTITFVSENTWYPAETLSITVLYNSAPGIGTSPLAARLANIARGRAPAALKAATGIASLVGFYEGRPGRGFTVTLENGALHAQPTGGNKVKLALTSGTTYAVGGTGVTVSFIVGVDGLPTGMLLREGARERVFQKTR